MRMTARDVSSGLPPRASPVSFAPVSLLPLTTATSVPATPYSQARADGEARPREAWEGSFFFLLAGSALVVALGSYKPNANVRDWARDEAAERMRRGAAGQEVLPGVNYAGLRMLKEAGALSDEEAAALEAGAIPVPARSLA